MVFSGYSVSSTNKTERHNIADILLKMAINTIPPPPPHTHTQKSMSLHIVCILSFENQTNLWLSKLYFHLGYFFFVEKLVSTWNITYSVDTIDLLSYKLYTNNTSWLNDRLTTWWCDMVKEISCRHIHIIYIVHGELKNEILYLTICDILIPCPLSYPFSQPHRIFSASNSLSAYFCTCTTSLSIFISSVCYQLHSRLLLFNFIIVI